MNFFILIFSQNCEISLFKNFLSNCVFLKNFGTYSFSIYLIHLNIIVWYNMYIRVNEPPKYFATRDENVLIIVFACYFAGFLCFTIIEKRCINFASYLCRNFVDTVEIPN